MCRALFASVECVYAVLNSRHISHCVSLNIPHFTQGVSLSFLPAVGPKYMPRVAVFGLGGKTSPNAASVGRKLLAKSQSIPFPIES